MKKVFVGMSGGVDSSVAALLLRQQGYKVVGVYMKNWSQDLPGHHCPWKEDYQDAKRVAVQLGIDFIMYDFEKQYKRRVVDFMLNEFKAGRTPNPDIMCNQEVKFKLFLQMALGDGADMIATGHYARILKGPSFHITKAKNASNVKGRTFQLGMAKDENKDQTYFLYRIMQEALAKTLFPLGDLTKPQVKELAKKHNLITADKKESMGICFVGKISIKDFLQNYVKTKPGKIIDQKDQVIGQHDGAIFYTIGQRHGLEVGGGLPFYVTGKDMKKNEVYVTTDLQDENLWSREVKLTDMHWISGEPKAGDKLMIRTRHRAKLIPVKKLDLPARRSLGEGGLSNSKGLAILDEEVRALTAGQSAVLYSGNLCLGGGIVV